MGSMKNPVVITMNEEIARINRIIKEAFSESERSGVVLVGAELDLILKSFLSPYFLPDQKWGINLFSPEGPLGDFSAKIEMAYRLGFLVPAQHHDLHIIRKIRNKFAHGEQGVGFNDDSLRDMCLNLAYGKLMIEQFNKESNGKEIKMDTKTRFIMTGTVLLIHISLARVNIKRTKLWFEEWTKDPGQPGVHLHSDGTVILQ